MPRPSSGHRPTRAPCAGAPTSWPTLGRRAEAADTLDRLAGLLEREGRLADACDVARRSLELAESRGRRRQVENLVARLRETPGDAAAAEALARALSVLETVARPGAAWRPQQGSASDEHGEAAPAEPSGAVRAGPGPADARGRGGARGRRPRRGPPARARRRRRPSRGRPVPRRDGRLLPGAGHPARRIRTSTSLLAELYLDRGWRGPAADKLVLLGPAGAADRRRGDPGAAVLPGGRPIPRRSAARRRLRLTDRARRRGPGATGHDATLGSHGASRIDPRSGQAEYDRRHRDHGAPDLLAVQAHPRDARGPPGHRCQRPRPGLRRWPSHSTCAC